MAGRPPLPIGTWGKITRTEIAPGLWEARAKYRDFDGRTRRVKRHAPGKTGAPAERALLAAMRDRSTPADTDAEITRDTTLEQLSAVWLTKRTAEEKLTPSTLDRYNDTIRVHIVPKLGGVRVSEATVGRLDAFIRAIPGAAASKQCRVVLSGMMQMAAQHDAIDRNPVRETTVRESERKPVRALTLDEVAAMRRRVTAWAGGNRLGPPRGQDIPDLSDVLIGTGTRIGEALAIRRDDIDFGDWGNADVPVEERRPPTVTIAGTINKLGKRQAWTKTDAGWRTVVLPDFAVVAIIRQIARDVPVDVDNLLFPGRHGGPRNPHNVRTQLRAAWRTIVVDEMTGKPDGPEDMFAWVTPHSFRRTVATIVEGEEGMRSASKQLGHASEDITRVHYVQKPAQAPDVRHVLDQLAPRTILDP